MARQPDNGILNGMDLLANLLQSSTTIAGIAIALDAALYVFNATDARPIVPSWLFFLVAGAGGLCIGASIKVIMDLIKKQPNPIKALLPPNEYASMLWGNILLMLALIFLHLI